VTGARALAVVGLAAVAIATLAGCAGHSEAECAQPSISVAPASIAPGGGIAVAVSNALIDCNDTGGGTNTAYSDPVTAALLPADATAPVASLEIPIGEDGNGIARLDTDAGLPEGTYVLEVTAPWEAVPYEFEITVTAG